MPTARLLLKHTGLDQRELQAAIRRQFAERGGHAERLIFEGGAVHTEFLGAYSRVDLALDTQPYSGGLTTCEALWMGVPVVTWPGQTFAGRHSTSHLNNAGYPQFVAADREGYVELAVQWAGRLEDLAAIRSQLPEQVRHSALCDARGFAGDLVELLRQEWHARAN